MSILAGTSVCVYLIFGAFAAYHLVDSRETVYIIYILKLLTVMCLYPFMALAAWAIKDME